MKHILFALSVLTICMAARAGEKASLSESQARLTASWFKTATIENRIILWCGCCKHDSKQELLVKYVSYRRTVDSGRYEFTLAGKTRSKRGTELFYEAVAPENVWIISGGIARNLVSEMGTSGAGCKEAFSAPASVFSQAELENKIAVNLPREWAEPTMMTTRDLLPGLDDKGRQEHVATAGNARKDESKDIANLNELMNRHNETGETVRPGAQDFEHDALMNGEKQAYTFVDGMPQPGVNVQQFLQKHLRYPKHAARHNIEGRVNLRFVVDEDGFVTDVQLLNHLNEDLEEEARRVVQLMPPWKPGTIQGKPVKVYYTLPINFRLQ